MCIRCVGKTFLVSMVLGASLAFIGVKTRAYVSHPATATVAQHRPTKIGYASSNRPPKLQEAEVAFFFERAPLGDVARFVSNVTHRKIAADLGVDTTQLVSFVSLQPVSSLEMYQRFLGLLQSHNLTLTYQGEFTMISPLPRRVAGYSTGSVAKPSAEATLSVDFDFITQARVQLYKTSPEKNAIKGAVTTVTRESRSQKLVHFSTVAVGSIWSRLGIRAGDSLLVTLGGSFQVTPTHGAMLAITRNDQPLTLHYQAAN